MSQHFSDPHRASDPHALPNIEVFHAAEGELIDPEDPNAEPHEAGWFWRACFPGCLPDGDPVGPFATKAEAVADAQDDAQDDAQEVGGAGAYAVRLLVEAPDMGPGARQVLAVVHFSDIGLARQTAKNASDDSATVGQVFDVTRDPARLVAEFAGGVQVSGGTR